MSPTEESREEAIRRLQKSASELEARSSAPKSETLAATAVVSKAYRIIIELLAGVLVGLGFGFAVDRLFHTTPFGILGGVLTGFAVSIWMAKRTADRLMAQAKAVQAADPAPPPAVRRGEEDEDD